MAEPTPWPLKAPEGAPRAVDLIADVLHDAFKGATDVDLDLLAAKAVDAVVGDALRVELRWYDGDGFLGSEGAFVLGRSDNTSADSAPVPTVIVDGVLYRQVADDDPDDLFGDHGIVFVPVDPDALLANPVLEALREAAAQTKSAVVWDEAAIDRLAGEAREHANEVEGAFRALVAEAIRVAHGRYGDEMEPEDFDRMADAAIAAVKSGYSIMREELATIPYPQPDGVDAEGATDE